MQVFGHGVQLVSKGEVEPRDTREMAARSLKMVQRSQSCRGNTVSLEPGIESVVNFCSFDSRKKESTSQVVKRW